MKFRPWLQGAGLAMLYLLVPLAEFLSPARRNFYHQLLPITTLTRGLLIDVLLLGALAGFGFLLLDRATPRLKQILWLPVFFVASWIAARNISNSITVPMLRGHLLQLTPYFPWAALAVVVVLLRWLPRAYNDCVRAAAVIFAAAGIALLLVILPRLVMACFSRMPREQAGYTHTVSNPWRPGQMRVVWILFDELSYNQAFEHRQPGIDLPAFTKLAGESVTFSQLAPVGYETEQVIPSLLLGQPVADVKGDADGRMLLRHDPNAPWQYFDQNATVFAAAKRQGWGTGVAGWYNPYCRILDQVLDRCYWTYNPTFVGELFSHFSAEQSAWKNARNGLPLAGRFESVWYKLPPNQGVRKDYRNILREGKALIQDPNIRLAFIHMSVPHPPGLFRNPTVAGPDAVDYLGNLILADQTLSQFLNVLATSPAAADTVLMVSSDHSWRVPRWRGVGWTTAEERATNGGVFDPRPVLMVRFPGHATPEHLNAQQIDRPESEMIEYRLLLDLIDGKVRTPEDWINTLPSAATAAGQGEQTAKK
jgi:hypothetical protein